jgi:hypothetical protein
MLYLQEPFGLPLRIEAKKFKMLVYVDDEKFGIATLTTTELVISSAGHGA